MVKVCGYWTNETYRREAEPLLRSLEKFSLFYQVGLLQGPSTWADAVLAKPRFILDTLSESAADAVLYTDADSEFVSRPDFGIFKDVDVSWHIFQRVIGIPPEHLTGTMFFRNTPSVRLFLEEWAKETEFPRYRASFTPEQDSLKAILSRRGKTIRIMALPAEWCWFDSCVEVYGERTPIVMHRQVSRKYRNLGKEFTEREGKNAEEKKEEAQA